MNENQQLTEDQHSQSCEPVPADAPPGVRFNVSGVPDGIVTCPEGDICKNSKQPCPGGNLKPLSQHVAPARNPAVNLCFESYSEALKEAEEKGMLKHQAVTLSRMAYLKAMPPLAGRENIRDFIACVTHGMILGILEPALCTRLLYAAQVAQTGASREPSKKKSE